LLPHCELKLWKKFEVKKFIKFVQDELFQYNIKLIFGRGTEVNMNGFRCSGYFDEVEVRVAKMSPDWLSVLVHEYSHFLQWKNRHDEYENIKINNVDSLKIIHDWIDGEEFRPSTVKKAFMKARKLEKKCEMLALEVIKKHNLPINVEKFICQANCHIYYYHMMEKTRKRSIKNQMFYSKTLKKIMPKTFKCKNVRYIPEKVYKIALTKF